MCVISKTFSSSHVFSDAISSLDYHYLLLIVAVYALFHKDIGLRQMEGGWFWKYYEALWYVQCTGLFGIHLTFSDITYEKSSQFTDDSRSHHQGLINLPGLYDGEENHLVLPSHANKVQRS